MLSSEVVEKCNLIKIIELLRQEMIETGIKEGLTSEKTIELSQKLDGYITVYQVFVN